MEDCDIQIDAVLKVLTKGKEGPEAKGTKNVFIMTLPGSMISIKMMLQLFDGKDLTVLPGITSYRLLKLNAQTGNNWSA
jgi:hypothetical protein